MYSIQKMQDMDAPQTSASPTHVPRRKIRPTGEVYITAQQNSNSTRLFYGRTSIDGSFLKYDHVIFNFITKATIQYMLVTEYKPSKVQAN
jgi:hypothetical protein